MDTEADMPLVLPPAVRRTPAAVAADPEDDVLPRGDAGAGVLVVVPLTAGTAEDDGVVLADVVLVGGWGGVGAPGDGGGGGRRGAPGPRVLPGPGGGLLAGGPGG